MASTYSTSLGLELIGQGEQSGTWGITTNNNFGTLVEQAITGVQSVSMSNATYTLSFYQGASDESRNAVLVVGGTNLAPQNLIAPAVQKVYIVNNKSGNTVNIKTSSGTGIAISNSTVAQVYCDGTDFYSAAPTINSLTGNFTATGTITSGGAMTSGGTLTAPTLSIAGTGSTGSNFSVGGNTYTYGLTNYGSQTVAGTEYVTGRITTAADIVSTGSTNYGSSQVNGNQVVNGTIASGSTITANGVLTTNSNLYVVGTSQFNGNVGMSGNLAVNGTLTATNIAGVGGTIKQIVIAGPVYPGPTTSSTPVPTGHIANIYPTAASSKILVMWYGAVSQPQYLGTETYALTGMFRNGAQTNALAGISVGSDNGALIAVTTSGQAFSYIDSANTTGLIQYQMYYWALGGGGAQCLYNDLSGSTITLIEIGQ
jgi:hypothetical protein